MTLKEFMVKHGQPPPSMGRDNVWLPEFIETTSAPGYLGKEWANDVIEYYKDPNAYLTLIRHIHYIERVETK